MAKFICCMTLRTGTLFISVLLFVVYALGISGARYLIKDHEYHNKATAIILLVFNILTLVVSAIGFYGTLRKKSRLVSLFSAVLNGLFVVHLILGSINLLVFLLRKKTDLFNDCLGDDRNSMGECQRSAKVVKFFAAGLFIITMLIQAYACYIVRSYAAELEQEGRSNAMSLDTSRYNINVVNENDNKHSNSV